MTQDFCIYVTLSIFAYLNGFQLSQYGCFSAHLQLRGWPRRMSQMSDLGAVSPETSMDAAALIADQHTPVNRGPPWLCNIHTVC